MPHKFALFIWNIIYDHWILSLSVSGFSIATAIPPYREKIIEWLIFMIQIWQVILIMVIVLGIYALHEKYFKDKEELCTDSPTKPENIIVKYEPELYAGVSWSFFMGVDEKFSDRRIWVDGPFCKKCIYELDKYEKSWFCVECNKRYKIPSQLRVNLQNKMIKIFTKRSSMVNGSKPVT